MILGLTLINEIEDRLGWRQTESLDDPNMRPDTRKLVRLLNRVLRSMQRLDTWPLLRTDAEIITVPSVVEVEYVTIVPGSSTLDLGLSNEGRVVFDETMVRRAVQIGGEPTLYRIVSVESPTSLTLNRPWVGAELDDEEVSVFIGQDQYALPADFDRPCGDWDSFLAPYRIVPVNPGKFKELRSGGGAARTDNPAVFTIYGTTPGENRQVLHLDPFPSNLQILNYSYQKDHPEIRTDADYVMMPNAKQDAVIEGVLYLASRDYTDDSKMEMVLRDYMRAISLAAGSKSPAEITMSLSPSGAHRKHSRGQWGYGARINWGSLFDRVDRVGFD